ncbi:MAG: ureidoglycolate lyase, partial [Fimbriimonadaceae bacterium]|nr:ureidoglycolate lyase [Alphaproteobacteria bacterium]
NYARGTWHHPLISLHEVSDFLVIDRGVPSGQGNTENLDEIFYPDSYEIWLHGA